jgi:ribosomal protein L29
MVIMMAAKTTETTNTTTPEFNANVVDLLNELRGLMRNFDPKKSTNKQVRRSLATLKAVIVDLEEELNK